MPVEIINGVDAGLPFRPNVTLIDVVNTWNPTREGAMANVLLDISLPEALCVEAPCVESNAPILMSYAEFGVSPVMVKAAGLPADTPTAEPPAPKLLVEIDTEVPIGFVFRLMLTVIEVAYTCTLLRDGAVANVLVDAVAVTV